MRFSRKLGWPSSPSIGHISPCTFICKLLALLFFAITFTVKKKTIKYKLIKHQVADKVNNNNNSGFIKDYANLCWIDSAGVPNIIAFDPMYASHLRTDRINKAFISFMRESCNISTIKIRKHLTVECFICYEWLIKLRTWTICNNHSSPRNKNLEACKQIFCTLVTLNNAKETPDLSSLSYSWFKWFT